MKHLTRILIVAVMTISAPNVFSQSSSALQGLFNKFVSGSNTSETKTDESDNTSSSSLGNILGAIGGVVENLVSTDDLEIGDIAGTWNYSAPAVAFKSEDLLKNAGGAAAASAIENKLANYYKYLRVESMKMVINQDSTFTMGFSKVTLSGDITKDEDGNFFFNYKVAGKVNIGSIQTYLTKSGNALDVMYDITKLIAILEKVGSFTGSSSIKNVSSILSGYDGITAGFKMVRSSEGE